MPVNYPYRNFRFRVDIDGIQRAQFSEVTGFDASVDVIEYREGDDLRNTPRKLPGLSKYGNVTLKWGIVSDREMFDWMATVAGTNTQNPTGITRKTITITLITDDGNDGPQWELINAWPVRYTAPDFNALGSEVAVESLEIAHEGLDRIDQGAPVAGEEPTE
ncbi:MAG: phage tail protein [Acetivibrionales bacterium]|jgi:phage tail-like protein